MIEKFSHVMMWAKSLDTTVQWYCDKLEYQVSYHAPDEFASLFHAKLGRLDLHGKAKDEDIGRGPMPYYRVKDMDEAMGWLKARGIKVENPQQVGESPRHTWFWDCEGNPLGIAEG